ncbi:hypothetical protein OED01_15115 [Microbacterium sp. M28]|uniref:hypothetical protein n=1 Tax=Microbacterium sp. M28 TaxID=2962064 RepID=UPI0021F425DA|nr:hypothetical protein [Microbacterium sp. M28]UYO96912.1 hypothetical protein OED01_15115 [Microbacterium sp. M28]
MVSADVVTPSQAEDLAARILARRAHPLLLVSTDPEGGFSFDVPRLRQELDGIADVVTVETGGVTRHLEQLLPPKTHAFGGTARSYPTDFGADPAWTRSHLRFPDHATTDDLIDDAIAQSVQRRVESAAAPRVRRASGVVHGFVADGTRAMVRLDDGTTVTATAELLPPDIPLLAALVVGERTSGILDGNELHPEPVAPDPDAFPDGSHTLALVVKVTELRATVQLHPRLSAVLRRRDVDAGDGPVSDVLAVGDVIRVRVTRLPDGTPALSRTDVDPDAALVPSLPLIAGGAPWLSEDRPPQQPSDAAAHTPAADEASALPPAALIPSPDVATRTDVVALSHQITSLRGDLLALTNLVARGSGALVTDAGELDRLRAENERLRAQLADERAERASTEAKLAGAEQDRRETGRALRDARRAAERSHVDATADGIRFEIERTWGNRTAPGERGRWPLRDYTLGPDFIDSLSPLDEGQLSKAIRTCVDAITGRDREIPARELHRLRTGEGGGDSYVVRQDGARCMRSSVEQNVAGARRLHYWELPGGGVELGRIVLHDDTKP